METLVNANYFKSIDGTVTRVELFADLAAQSPRIDTDCNLTIIATNARHWASPDKGWVPSDFIPGEFCTGQAVEARYAALYLNVFCPEILAWGFVDHGYNDGSLSLTPGADHNSFGVDETHDGIVVLARSHWEEAMGEFYTGDNTPESVIEQELKSYNAWAAGDYVGYVTSDWLGDEWVESDSCWGFESEEYASEEALQSYPEGMVECEDPELDL